jgi:hypothetical protein
VGVFIVKNTQGYREELPGFSGYAGKIFGNE